MHDPQAARAEVEQALAPILAALADVDVAAPDAAARLEERLPLSAPALTALRALVRRGVEAGVLAERASPASGGAGAGASVRYSRVRKAPSAGGLSVDVVHMDGAEGECRGGAHTHGNGEIDLCFALDEGARFDGHPEGWVVFPPGSWHVPTVRGGRMDILYFLPGGAITFEERS